LDHFARMTARGSRAARHTLRRQKIGETQRPGEKRRPGRRLRPERRDSPEDDNLTVGDPGVKDRWPGKG
jgi:hypothetical protein